METGKKIWPNVVKVYKSRQVRTEKWKEKEESIFFTPLESGEVNKGENKDEEDGRRRRRRSKRNPNSSVPHFLSLMSPLMAAKKSKGANSAKPSSENATSTKIWLYSLFLTLQYGAQPLISKRCTRFISMLPLPLRFWYFFSSFSRIRKLICLIRDRSIAIFVVMLFSVIWMVDVSEQSHWIGHDLRVLYI